MLKGFVLGFSCFIVFLAAHVVVFHCRRVVFRFNALVGIFLAVLPLYIVLYVLIPNEALVIMPADLALVSAPVIGLSKTFNFLVGLLFYLLLFFGYCQFYFIVDRSISVRIMIEIEKSKEKRLSFEQIKAAYSPDYIFSRRLKHMIDNHYLVEEKGGYVTTARGKVYARVMEFIKGYLNLGPGG